MRRNYPSDPMLQPIKGIFIFQEGDEFADKAVELMKNLRCEVTSTRENRVTVKTSRGNLQTIKKNWLATSKDDKDPVSQELKQCITQIIIGGNA